MVCQSHADLGHAGAREEGEGGRQREESKEMGWKRRGRGAGEPHLCGTPVSTDVRNYFSSIALLGMQNTMCGVST